MARSVSCLLLGLLASASALSLGARAAPAAAARGCPTMMAAAAFRTGDMVKILSGDDKGAVGKVISLDRKTNKVVVEGVNVRTKHVKPMKEGEQGRLLKREVAVHLSNVAPSDEPAPAEAAAPAAE